MKMGFRRRFLVLAGTGLLFIPAPVETALADSPVETAIRDFVAAVDASPGWSAAFRQLSYDEPSDTAILSGLSIATPAGEVKIDFESISVAGYAAGTDGSFTAKSIKTDGVAVDFGVFKMAIDDIVFEDVGVPVMLGGTYDREKPFTSIMAIYSGAAKARLGHGHIGSFSVIEVIEGVTTRIDYQNFEISDLHDGRTASITGGPIKMQSPSPDGLVNMTVAGVEATDMDLGAMIRVYDPSQYAGDGTGDMIWHTTLGHAAYKGVEMVLPGAKLAVGDFSMDDFKVRQPKHSFAPFLDAIIAHPDRPGMEAATPEVREGLVDLMSAFSMGRFSVTNVKVQASGIDQFAIRDFHIADFSIDGLGEMAVEGLAGAVEGQGSIKIGRLAFGGMTFPDAELLRSAVRSAGAPNQDGSLDLDPTGLVPKLGFVEASGIEVQSSDIPHLALDKLRVDLSDYVGFIPTRLDASLSGLDMPVSAMDPQSRETFARLGYDHISLDYRLRYAWEKAREQLAVNDLHLRAADIGAITGSAVIGGVTRALLEHPDNPDGALRLSLVSGKLTFSDESIVGKGLGLIAEKMKAPPDKFRQQFADALPFLLSVSALNNPALMTILRQSGLMRQLTPAVKTFVAEPFGSLTVTMKPAAPVDFAAIGEAADKAPETLIGLLNLSVTAKAGKPPAEKAPPDAIVDPNKELRPTIQP